MMFITTNTKGRSALFAESTYARIAVDVIYECQMQYPFYLHAFVVMPDHIHMMITPPKHGSISKIMYHYKRSVSFTIGKGPIWQKRFDCRIVRDPALVLQYIHQNPVQKKFCSRPEEYIWSSASAKWDVTELDWMGCFL